ncbi:hypothetical protein BLS_003904 [Venturia inaequalis]|uniref:Uncharacterized protein n=1 Tax=Venturia inaequalis TaxID=5025 RepID=A0A8H3ZHQ5_VENIN|nr:hypothetical protein BLS_003904 [Venturia inaequalis]KAE9993837.1 hypothetical protein EG327_003087 [Venturia inaequalis]
MSDKSYSDSEASDSTDLTQEAEVSERVKLVPVSLVQKRLRISSNSKIAESTTFAAQKLRTKKPFEDSANGSLDGKNLFGNARDRSDVRHLFDKRENAKHRKYSDSGYHSLNGDTTESEYSSTDSGGDSEHDTDDTSRAALQDAHAEDGGDEDDDEDTSVDGDDDETSRKLATVTSKETQNKAVTHFWPLRPDGIEMTAQEYMDWKIRGFKFECEPAAYRWDDGEAPVDREEPKGVKGIGLDVVNLLLGLDLPSSCMNFEKEGYDFENPFAMR